jgi:purine-binding chemotaxis protein CheW
VVNHRGALLPIVDQRGRFGPGADDRSARRRVVVTKLGDLQVGFVVDAVSQIASLPSAQVQQTPDLTREGARLFDRIATLPGDGRMILLIAPRELLDRTERDVVAALATGGGGAAAS